MADEHNQNPPAQQTIGNMTPPAPSEPGHLRMRNQMNGEIKDAESLGGKDAHGRDRYKAVTGWEPVGNHTVDTDGSWLEIVDERTAAARKGPQVMAQSGASAVLGDEAKKDLEESTAKVAAARQPPSDAISTPDGQVVRNADGSMPEGHNDLGDNLQTGKKRGR